MFNSKRILFCLAVVFVVGGCTQHKPPPPPVAQQLPNKDEMMAMWKDYSTPGSEHKVLNSLVGNWDHTVQMWMEPNTQPEISKGKSTIKWTMGGRFLEHTATGKSMGQKFEGKGYMGYDRATKEYRTVWFDNMGTGFMFGQGSYNAAANQLEDAGTASCPMFGTMQYRSVLTMVDPTHFKYEMFMMPPKMPESKAMEINYTKRKA